ncbi:F-box/LRR-repeat protein [Trifolium medium]|uniref:F-box/LRR-repeat protein n=1 Tax=Trifolium medium TaxID=97028 RepID=A0A392PYA7_9FABA|nr:F-box/LRR-repeat protein [Trifolium medium]
MCDLVNIFGGDASQFSKWKKDIECHFTRADESLWNLVQNGISLTVNSKGIVNNRKNLNESKRQHYRNHHKSRCMMLKALSQAEFNKLANTSTAKAIFDSLCDLYERKMQDDNLEAYSDGKGTGNNLITTWDSLDQDAEPIKSDT